LDLEKENPELGISSSMSSSSTTTTLTLQQRPKKRKPDNSALEENFFFFVNPSNFLFVNLSKKTYKINYYFNIIFTLKP
jgi:hypothetical protein